MEQYYKKIVKKKLNKKFKYKNIMQIPKIIKIVLNIGIGKCMKNKKFILNAKKNLKLITGQKPIFTQARKSISNFKIRTGWNIGLKVTLRKKKMYFFLDKLIHITIPVIKDFRGFNYKSFDKNGNFNFGIKEHIIFPEIQYNNNNDDNQKIGMNICINTSAKTNEEAFTLLKLLNFPIKK